MDYVLALVFTAAVCSRVTDFGAPLVEDDGGWEYGGSAARHIGFVWIVLAGNLCGSKSVI